jgi:DNA-binding PadR family transcriptional regulator
MSIKHGLLALLRADPKYGYQLRGEFEAATGSTWPLNIGQVYTTLTRLERDGLVQPATDPAASDTADGRSMYEITDAGRAELTNWFETPVTRESRPRDELAIKLALALAVPGVNVAAVVQRQRAATMQSLQELTRLKRNSRDSDISWLLVLESMIFAAEAEIRWLDHCEAMLSRHRRTTTPATQSRTETPTGPEARHTETGAQR